MKIRLPWNKKAEPEIVPEEDSNLTITDGTYGRLEHILRHDPDGFGLVGTVEEMHARFHRSVSPREFYGFDHDLTIEDFEHALSGAYKGEPHG